MRLFKPGTRCHKFQTEEQQNMSVKESFTAEEWQTLLQLPLKVGVTLMVLAPSGPIGLTKETMALVKAPFALAQASNANALVSALAVELQAQAKTIVKSEESAFKHSDPMTYKGQTMAACHMAATALSKASVEDAGAYRAWVLAVGQQVAEAAKDGGVRVSNQEQALLKEMEDALAAGAAW
jgi:hypothetical protein